MVNGRFRQLGNADKATRRFVAENLEGRVMRADCPKSINLDLEFSRFLQTHGIEALEAAEIAAEQRLLVRRRVSRQIERWVGQGVSSPINFVVESEEVVISWRHERFAELTGSEPPVVGFVDVYVWLSEQSNRAFLLPCLCFLKLLGCDPIFVTDGARDEGIDCIGLIATGELRSTAVFIQARSAAALISGDPLLQEYAKYAALPRTHKYMQYLDALGVLKLQDGAGYLYAVLTNSDFHYAAQQNAARLGVLLRSRRQIAHFISQVYSVRRLEQIRAELKIPETGDLTTNLAAQLSP
jgi:hypothetical protein